MSAEFHNFDGTSAASPYNDRSDDLNVTALSIERVGNLVKVTAQFLKPFGPFIPGNLANAGVNLWFLLDSRCIPESAGFRPCTGACTSNPSNPLAGISIIDYNDEDYFAQYDEYSALVAHANAPSPILASNWIPYQWSPDGGATVFYGQSPFLYAGNSTSSVTIGVNLYSFSLTYYTNSSSDWTIPDVCRGGICQAANFYP